jgi:heme-degrading monooxygenase HmoA
MILEVAILDVVPGRSAEFEAAFAQAQPLIAASPGYRRHQLRRCVEARDRYLLLVWWQDLASHTKGFRGGPAYPRWNALLHPFHPFPTVEHYAPLFGDSD